MAKRDKRLEKARRNPKGVTFEELCQIYLDAGFYIRSGGKGSHFIAKLSGTSVPPRTVPRRNPLKSVYVREALEAIEEAQEYID